MATGSVRCKENLRTKLWDDIITVLEAFVKFLETFEQDGLMETWATSCNDAAYTDRYILDPNHKERTMCRLMLGALMFKNGWRGAQQDIAAWGEDAALMQFVQCAIVSIYMYYLLEINCGQRKGVDQAFTIMSGLERGFPSLGMPVNACRWETHDATGLGTTKIKPGIRSWLSENEYMSGKIAAIRHRAHCAQGSQAKEKARSQVSPETIKREILDKLGDLKKEVQTKKQEYEQAGRSPSSLKNSDAAKDKGKASTTSQSGEGVGRTAPPKTPAPPPPPPPEPARPAAPSEPTGANGAAAPTGAGDQPTQVPTESNGGSATEHTTSKDGHGSSAVAGAAPAAPESQPLTPVSTMGQAPDTGSTPDVATTISSSTPGAPPTQADPVDAVPGSQAPVHSVDQSTADRAGQGVAVGNDDPPPLNPPKPNPNPDQSGSSGSFSDADLADGVSGGEGKGGESGEKDADSAGSASPGGGTSTSGGGGGGAGGSGTEVGTPSVPPGLTWEDVTWYTPAIIPAVVGIGLIAFFLWKYFAYLGKKRRRMFRTVRDVPSPPLDEEILEHLQRAELPPPAYGYTMIRDTQPASTSARRRRQPRVHKRTIIDLHLEVLNECEVTEWEHVKDDYWQILVQEFMGGNNGHSSCPDAPSTNQGPPGINVSFTVDPPTDSDATDPCPPNEHDPWSCMETIQFPTDPCPPNKDDPDPWSCVDTIQLATHPCPPNENDPDPWSCMKSIQLATDPCAPHDPDPWSCMETIQLQTHPCAPNEDDPDPWTCMENIQLATDTSPPNEHDPDPWSCMETRQLATHPCPPNENDPDPWSCMENIPLATDPCPDDDPDPCSSMQTTHCMETIQLDTAPDPHSSPGNENRGPDCTNWINWIELHKHLLRECTTQPWLLQLKADWTQYLREHIAADDVSGHIHNGEAATLQMSTLRLWKAWVAQQHRQMSTYKEEQWFPHLFNNVEEEIESQTVEVPGVEKDLEVEQVKGTEDRVRDLPRSQPLHPQPYMKKRLTAKICILLLALVIEACELECRLQQTELYVDDLLEQL
ncbi:hypothetical protein AK88_02176 [Plasmodium fragile]|uniref:Schizont-infected cell agglutination C-terminal domain-containing protein n=1 Tax=Plasmodium fragile TaxID=5857 RepID=A0A0D9QMG9_PLAFR|nr:uncharacterized protein AK88_02176 [Plasmodium fragile]KJP88229.1 hypothetical protein AK88_02176 [Plasmodium fragile]